MRFKKHCSLLPTTTSYAIYCYKLFEQNILRESGYDEMQLLRHIERNFQYYYIPIAIFKNSILLIHFFLKPMQIHSPKVDLHIIHLPSYIRHTFSSYQIVYKISFSFGFGLQTLFSIDFSKTHRLESLKPKIRD